jgi:hypothetical protein
MADIKVEPIDEGAYRVTVEESGFSSTHEVTVPEEQAARYPDLATEQLIEASFRFLLDREPKESIMSRFDIGVIPRYFPEYESRLGDYL